MRLRGKYGPEPSGPSDQLVTFRLNPDIDGGPLKALKKVVTGQFLFRGITPTTMWRVYRVQTKLLILSLLHHLIFFFCFESGKISEGVPELTWDKRHLDQTHFILVNNIILCFSLQ